MLFFKENYSKKSRQCNSICIIRSENVKLIWIFSREWTNNRLESVIYFGKSFLYLIIFSSLLSDSDPYAVIGQ